MELVDYLKPKFSVALTSKAYADQWEAVFRPCELQRRREDGSWETVSRHKTLEDAVAAIPADGGVYRATEPAAS